MSTKRPHKARLGVEPLEDRCLMATRVWDGGATSNNWTSANNWVGNVAPVAGDDLVFPANASDKTADNTFANGTLFNSITLGGGYSLKGNRVRLGSGGIVDNSGSSNIIKLDLTVGVTGETAIRQFNVGTGSTLFIDGEIDGTLGLIKAGGGNLSFRANNSYVGQTQVNAGILFVEKDGSLGGLSGGVLVKSGATLLANDNAVGKLRIDEAITLEGGATLRALNDVELGGTVTLLGLASFKQETAVGIDKLVVAAPIVGAGGITILAGSHIRFQANTPNSYLGATVVAGELFLDHGHTAIPGALTINSGGVVRLQQANQISDLANVTVNGTGELQLNRHDERINSLSLNGGSVAMDAKDVTAALSSGTLAIQAGFSATSAAGGDSARLTRGKLLLQSANQAITVNDGSALLDLIIDHTEGSFVKKGAGNLLLDSGAETANYLVDAGVLQIEGKQKQANVTVNAGGQIAGNGTIGNLTVNAGGIVDPGELGSIGRLVMEGDLLLRPDAILVVSLVSGASLDGHDSLQVVGQVTLSDAILQPLLSNTSPGDQFIIIDNVNADDVIGRFHVPAETDPFLMVNTGQRLSLNYAGDLFENDVIVTHENTSPMAPGLAIDQTDIFAGTIVTVTGHLVDPDGPQGLKLLVDWGDGSKKQILKPGLNDFTLRHRYRRPGEFVARFKWIDQTGQGNGREFTISVEPGISSGGNQLRSLTDRVFAPGLRR